MKPGAFFYLDEYTGPSRFQTSLQVVSLIDSIRESLPERLKLNLFAGDGSVIGNYVPSPVEHFEKRDPSEAVRSSEIIPILKMYFDIIAYRPYGGTILHMLLSGITGNFDENDERDQSLLKIFALMEEAIEGSIGGSDFAVIVAQPKSF